MTWLLWLRANWKLVAAALVVGGAFIAGYHVRALKCEAAQTIVLKEDIKTLGDAHEVHNTIRALPAGDASKRLLKSWSRD